MKKNQKIETFIVVFMATLVIMFVGSFAHFWTVNLLYLNILSLLLTTIIVCISKSKHKVKLTILLTATCLLCLIVNGAMWYHDNVLYPEYPSYDIRVATNLKFEYAFEEDGSFIFVSNGHSFLLPFVYNMSSLIYEPTSLPFEGEWIYRIIINEGWSNEVEILVGEESTLVNGVNYIFPSTEEITSEELQKEFIEERLPYWYQDEDLNLFRTTEEELPKQQ